jgi:hypothetical protein
LSTGHEFDHYPKLSVSAGAGTDGVRTSRGSFFIHDTVATFPAANRLSWFDLVLCTTVYITYQHVFPSGGQKCNHRHRRTPSLEDVRFP